MADDVRSLQEALMLCGYYPGDIDGMMGPNTKNALKGFQEERGLAADGILGPMSRSALATALGEAATKASGLQGFYEGGGTSAEDDL